MPNITYLIDSFSTGEIDPQMTCKVTLAKYKTACKVQRNFFTHVNGATSNRSGTIFVAPTKFSTTNQSAVKNAKLIPFQFSTQQSYMLEFGDYYVRFYKNGAQIQAQGVQGWLTNAQYAAGAFVTYGQSTYYAIAPSFDKEPDTQPTYWTPQTIYEVPTSYPQSAVMQIGYTQSADTLFLAHPDYPPQMVQRISDADWTIQAYPFTFGPWQLDNTNNAQMLSAVYATPGGTTSVSSVVITNGGSDYSGSDVLTIVQAGGSGATFQVGNTNGGAVVQSGITLLSGGTGYASGNNLATTGSSTGSGCIVTITIGVWQSAQMIPINVSVTLTASGCTPFQAGHVGSLWELFHYVPNQQANVSISSSGPTGSIICGGTWRLITNGTWTGTVWIEKSLDGGNTWLQLNSYYGVNDFNANTFGTEDMSNNAPPFLVRGNCTLSSGTVQFTVTCNPFIQPGMVQVTQVQSSTVVYGVVRQPIGLANTPTSDWAEGAWSNVRGFPSVVEFTPDDRLMWANSPSFPENSWMTKTSNYYDFNVNNPLVDSDSLNVTLPSRQINGINGLIPLRAILALTTSGEWSVESVNGVSAPLTPSTIYQRVHGYEGSQGVRPVVIGIRAIFVQQLGKIIRDVGYELIYDAFVGANLSIFSNHLFFFNTIIDMAYQKNPDSMVWMVRNDGQLISMTYLREQNVVSFARHDTNGNFLCVACLSNYIQNFDEVWVIVNRTNGQFVEYFSQRSITTTCNDDSELFDIANQIFMDCSTTFGANRVAILSIAVGNPTVVTTNEAHGFTNGQTVKLFNLSVNTQFNNTTWIIGGVTSTTFELITEL